MVFEGALQQSFPAFVTQCKDGAETLQTGAWQDGQARRDLSDPAALQRYNQIQTVLVFLSEVRLIFLKLLMSTDKQRALFAA